MPSSNSQGDWNRDVNSRLYLAGKLEAVTDHSPGVTELWHKYVTDGQWKRNRLEHAEAWNAHYAEMGLRIMDFINRTRKDLGIDTEEMNVAFVGMGDSPIILPAQSELFTAGLRGEMSTDSVGMYQHLNTVTIMDISQRLIRSCAENLWAGHMPKEKTVGFQADVTRGDVMGYGRLLREIFAGTNGNTTEAMIANKVKRLKELDIAAVTAAKGLEIQDIPPEAEPSQIINGYINETGELKVIRGGEPVPLHAVVHSNCLAGLGAAHEQKYFWDLYKAAVEKKPITGERVNDRRFEMHETLYGYINMFGTEMMTRTLKNFSRDNPGVSQLAIFDEDTQYKDSPITCRDWSTLSRVDVPAVTASLQGCGLKVRKQLGYRFDDADDHGHGMTHLEVSGTLKKKLPPIEPGERESSEC